ncbi:hypothetical protein [Rhizobium sp. SG741]|nr:hypothetical protein [Rhizobium sp. SG741]
MTKGRFAPAFLFFMVMACFAKAGRAIFNFGCVSANEKPPQVTAAVSKI